jgi:hypothetical protein
VIPELDERFLGNILCGVPALNNGIRVTHDRVPVLRQEVVQCAAVTFPKPIDQLGFGAIVRRMGKPGSRFESERAQAPAPPF